MRPPAPDEPRRVPAGGTTGRNPAPALIRRRGFAGYSAAVEIARPTFVVVAVHGLTQDSAGCLTSSRTVVRINADGSLSRFSTLENRSIEGARMFRMDARKPVHFCDGLTRRDFLHAGSLASLGLWASRVPEGEMGSSRCGDAGFDVNCILLFLVGGPSQLGRTSGHEARRSCGDPRTVSGDRHEGAGIAGLGGLSQARGDGGQGGR